MSMLLKTRLTNKIKVEIIIKEIKEGVEEPMVVVKITTRIWVTRSSSSKTTDLGQAM